MSHILFLYKFGNPKLNYNQLIQETIALPLIPGCGYKEQKPIKGVFTGIKEALLVG